MDGELPKFVEASIKGAAQRTSLSVTRAKDPSLHLDHRDHRLTDGHPLSCRTGMPKFYPPGNNYSCFIQRKACHIGRGFPAQIIQPSTVALMMHIC